MTIERFGAYITIDEAAAAAGVTRATIRRRIERVGVSLVPSPLDRRFLLVRAEDLPALVSVEAAIERREVAA